MPNSSRDPPLLLFRSFAPSTTPSSLSCMNEYLATDSDGRAREWSSRKKSAWLNASQIWRVGVGMNRSGRV